MQYIPIKRARGTAALATVVAIALVAASPSPQWRIWAQSKTTRDPNYWQYSTETYPSLEACRKEILVYLRSLTNRGSDDDRAQSYKTECLQTDGEEELSRFRGMGLNPDPEAEWLMLIPTRVEGTWAFNRDQRYYTQADCESAVKLAQAKGGADAAVCSKTKPPLSQWKGGYKYYLAGYVRGRQDGQPLVWGRIISTDPATAVQGPIPNEVQKREANILILQLTDRCFFDQGVRRINPKCLFRFVRHEYGMNDYGMPTPVWVFEQVDR